MKIYWSNKDIPELANLTPDQQRRAWQACYWKYTFKYWQTWASCGLVAFFVSLGMAKFGPVLGGAIGGGLGGFVFSQVAMNVLRPHLRDYVEKNFLN
jgi:hypothetical protein